MPPLWSNQPGPHPRLAERVGRHLDTLFRRPVAEHTRQAFERLQARIEPGRPLILDAGCGVGESTGRLAECFPDALIIGVDKSARRLSRQPALPGNALLLRAELADFWRLALDADWRLQRHYVLYPNPWPKATHFSRRWHGSPLWPVILALGGRLELRSNWRLYVEEWRQALALAGIAATVEPLRIESPLTPFERKYHVAGQVLWRCTACLGGLRTADSAAAGRPAKTGST